MILYIHGFASSGLGAKAETVREYFGEEAFAPSLPYVPDLAMDTLIQIAEQADRRREPLYLIGSSLGGFYALYLAERFDCKAVLVNPSTRPWETLAAHTGEGTNYYDGARFEWTPQHVERLRKYRVPALSHPEKILLMLQTGDEVLDYRLALEELKGAQTLLEEGGDHSFRGFEKHLPRIEAFFRSGLSEKHPSFRA
ncbi:YqiA/YcfP family alpha/beta fold hydrolase [Nitratifractor sp.]|uniref:YqiA/YcfP family alpha/beta fold hydrolase n=1 Tax=Nitratifractor sp. TaxID=2268144 RepID=UPI0025F25F5E|nr:YqiA/YcfP family alpha/beta fold hydrolase [Nitratifractor sp.]